MDTPVTPTPATKTRQMSFSILEDGTVRADFGPGVDPVSFNPGDPNQIPESLYPAALAGGVIARLRGYTSRLLAEARTPEALRSAIVRGLSDLAKGTWAAEREAGGGAGEISLEAEAAWVYRQMRAASKKEEYTETLEVAAAAFSALSEEQKKTLKALPRYQLAYAQVKAAHQAKKAEKLAKKVSEDEDDTDF